MYHGMVFILFLKVLYILKFIYQKNTWITFAIKK